MYGNNANMYSNIMGQHGSAMMGQMGVGQLGTQMGAQMPGQSGHHMGQMQMGGQMQPMTAQTGQQQGSLQQPASGLMTAMPGVISGLGSMSGLQGMNMPSMGAMTPAAGATGAPATSTAGFMGQQASGMMGQPGAGMIGQQGTGMMGQQGTGMMSQQGVGVMGQQGMANWPGMAAGNPQAMAAMQAYMQQYAMRMAAYQRMAAAASAGGMGSMGPMAGPMGGMGMGHMMAAHMNQQQHQLQQMRASQQQHQGGQDGGEVSRYWKTRICNKWKDGHCPYGDTCKYAHGDGDLRTPGMDKAGASRGAKPEVADKRTMIELMKKTRICEEFVKTGSCKYGDKCTFAHGYNELRQAPNPGSTVTQPQGGGGKEGGGSSVHKTRLCERFMNTNNCPYGDKCTFAHGHHELRKPGAAVTGGNGGKSQGQQKQKKQQHKGADGAGAAAAVGSKREREDAAGGATPGGADAGSQEGEPAKRQHVEGADAGAVCGGGDEEQPPQDQGLQGGDEQLRQDQGLQEEAGTGDGRWGWGSSPSPRRDNDDDGDGDGGSDDDARRQRHSGDDGQEQEDEETEDQGEGTTGELLAGHGAAGSPGAAGASAAAAVGHADGAHVNSDAAKTSGADADGGGAAGGSSTGADADGCSESQCRLCARMAQAGRDRMLSAVQQLANPGAQKLGAMILGYGTPRFEQLWHKLSFGQLQSMLGKSELSVADRIELLRTVNFHCHAPEEERERLESQKYVSQGLPPDVADFVAMVLDGKEGSAQMTEYFAALEVCKSLYGVTEEEYFNVSSTMANLFMNM